jgi:hypothetical protein
VSHLNNHKQICSKVPILFQQKMAGDGPGPGNWDRIKAMKNEPGAAWKSVLYSTLPTEIAEAAITALEDDECLDFRIFSF